MYQYVKQKCTASFNTQQKYSVYALNVVNCSDCEGRIFKDTPQKMTGWKD